MRSVVCDVVFEKVGFPSASTDIFARGVIVKYGGSPDTTPRAPQFKRRYMFLCIPFTCCYSSRAPRSYPSCISSTSTGMSIFGTDTRLVVDSAWSGGASRQLASRTRSIRSAISIHQKVRFRFSSHASTSVSRRLVMMLLLLADVTTALSPRPLDGRRVS